MYWRKGEVKTNLNQRDLYVGSKLSCHKTLPSKGINVALLGRNMFLS